MTANTAGFLPRCNEVRTARRIVSPDLSRRSFRAPQLRPMLTVVFRNDLDARGVVHPTCADQYACHIGNTRRKTIASARDSSVLSLSGGAG